MYLVYRRTNRYMPADEHELVLAVEDECKSSENCWHLRNWENGQLICRVMKLGVNWSASVVQALFETDETVAVPADA